MGKVGVTVDTHASARLLGRTVRRGEQKRMIRYSLVARRTTVEISTGEAFFGMMVSSDPKRQSIEGELSVHEGYEGEQHLGQLNFVSTFEHDGQTYPSSLSFELWPDPEVFGELWRLAVRERGYPDFRFHVLGMNYIDYPDGSRMLWDIEKEGTRLDIEQADWSLALDTKR